MNKVDKTGKTITVTSRFFSFRAARCEWCDGLSSFARRSAADPWRCIYCRQIGQFAGAEPTPERSAEDEEVAAMLRVLEENPRLAAQFVAAAGRGYSDGARFNARR